MGNPEYEHEKEHEREINDGPDPISNAALPNTEEDVVSEMEVAIEAMGQDSDLDDKQISREQQEQREELSRAKSHVTEVSVASMATSSAAAAQAQPKTWSQKINPLRWFPVPRIPAERSESPEAKAGFFSKLIFHWQGPLMRVCDRTPSALPPLTGAHSGG